MSTLFDPTKVLWFERDALSRVEMEPKPTTTPFNLRFNLFFKLLEQHRCDVSSKTKGITHSVSHFFWNSFS